MISVLTAHPATLTEPLGEDEVRLLSLLYQRTDGREPLRRVLAAYLHVDTQAVQLAEDAYGKPRLAGHVNHALQFNWSHSGDRAVIALAMGVAPGIDLERYRVRPRALDIAQRYFAPPEIEQLAQLPDSQRSDVFLRLWTAKEALLKALGRGLAFGLNRLSVHARDDGDLELVRFDTQRAQDWQLHAVTIDSAHAAALAWRGAARRVTVARWEH